MTDGRIEAVLRRDRAIVLAALAMLVALAWIYIAWIAAASGMDGHMSGRAAHSTMTGGGEGRNGFGADALVMLLMWTVMMIGMMVPSAAPMILLYARVGRQALDRGTPFAAAGWFATGYLLAWTAFAVVATLLQLALARAWLLTPMMTSASPYFAGGLLIAAGLYQWTPLKDSCLAQCQSPLLFIQRHGGFRGDRGGAVALGLRHGAYCIGCCWALMTLLFVGGVMNLLWIAAISVLVLAEKAFRVRLFRRTVGLALIVGGMVLASVPGLVPGL